MFLRIYSTAGVQIAEVTVPDTAALRLRTAFGGTTAAETAQNVLNYLLRHVHAEQRRRNLELKWAADYGAVRTNQDSEATAIDTDFPPPL